MKNNVFRRETASSAQNAPQFIQQQFLHKLFSQSIHDTALSVKISLSLSQSHTKKQAVLMGRVLQGSPFGIRESGGSQHSIWKPRSQESQKSILSWNWKDKKKSTLHFHNQTIKDLSKDLSYIYIYMTILLDWKLYWIKKSLKRKLKRRKEAAYCIFALDSTGTARLTFNTLPSQGLHICCQLQTKFQAWWMS